MCKFHQDVALDVATLADGTVDPTIYALNIIALGANCSIKHHMPEMAGIKGSMTYRLAAQSSQEALANSHIVYDKDAFESYRGNTLGFLQQQAQETMVQYGFDTARPKVIKSRIKTFLQTAPDELYKSFDDLSPAVFKNRRDADAYQNLRLAAASYWNNEDVGTILTERFKQSLATIITKAPEQANPTLLRLYENLPDKVKTKANQFSECAGGMCASAGGTLMGHLGCIAKFAVLPALGVSSGGIGHDPAVMYGIMMGGTALGVGLWQYMHYRRGTNPSKLENFVTYGTALIGLGAVVAWHELGDGHAHHDHTPSNITYFDDDAGRRFMVRDELLCGVRTVKDTLIDGKKTDLVMPYNTRRIDTIQISGAPQNKYPSIAR